MKIVFVVYHDLKIEARSFETLQALKKLGDVCVVTRATPFDDNEIETVISECKIKYIRYFLFLFRAIRTIKKVNPDVVCLHDLSLLVPYSKKKGIKIVYDQSELLIDRQTINLKTFLLNILNISDRINIKKSDVILTTNVERANVMREYYKLNKMPIVFDNIHKIDEEYDEKQCEKKYLQYFKKNTMNIVSGGGLWRERRIYELIEIVIQHSEQFNLIIVGAAPEGMSTFNRLVAKDTNHAITYLGFVSRADWRYLLSKADISFSAYMQICLNNILCASGKTYESLFEGTPILVSSNPPFFRLCEVFKCGVSSDDFEAGLELLARNYQFYKKNAQEFSAKIDYYGRIDKLAKEIKLGIDTAE